MLGIIHSILIRENNSRVPNLAMSVIQSRENSRNVIKPSILTKKALGVLSSGAQDVNHFLQLSGIFSQQILTIGTWTVAPVLISSTYLL